MWDGEFAGSIGLRWQPGTAALPPTCPGHIGFAVVPWKRGRGHAKHALGETLNEARARGLEYVELTTTPDNLPSQKVIEANGGRLVARVTRGRELGGGDALLYRIMLASIEKASA
jgi:predicted acetyltransferase